MNQSNRRSIPATDGVLVAGVAGRETLEGDRSGTSSPSFHSRGQDRPAAAVLLIAKVLQLDVKGSRAAGGDQFAGRIRPLFPRNTVTVRRVRVGIVVVRRHVARGSFCQNAKHPKLL